MTDKLQHKGLVLALAILCCLLWGSAYPSVKIGYLLFDIQTTGAQVLFAGYRFTLAGIFTWMITCGYAKKIVVPRGADWGRMVSLGLVQTALQYSFFYIGLANTTGVKAAIINATATFFAILFAHLILRNEKITRARIVGCILGMTGVILIQFKGGQIDSSFAFLGEGFLFLAAIVSALGAVMTRIYTKKIDAMILTAYQLMIGGSVLVVLGLMMGGTITQVTHSGLLMLGYLSALSATAFSIWATLLKHNPVGIVAIYGFMIPVFGVILSGLFLGEEFLSLRILVSLACVSVGIWLVNREAGQQRELKGK